MKVRASTGLPRRLFWRGQEGPWCDAFLYFAEASAHFHAICHTLIVFYFAISPRHLIRPHKYGDARYFLDYIDDNALTRGRLSPTRSRVDIGRSITPREVSRYAGAPPAAIPHFHAGRFALDVAVDSYIIGRARNATQEAISMLTEIHYFIDGALSA